MKYISKGFPHRVTDKLDIPDIAELLLTPNLRNGYVEDVMKYGTEFQRWLIDQTQLVNSKKYIYVTMATSFLYPGVSPVINIHEKDLEWHIDTHGNLEEDDIVYHILQNDTSSKTDFNCAEFELETDDVDELLRSFNKDPNVKNLIVPKEAEPFKIYTFNNNNIHRAKRTQKQELRFFYRVVETDFELYQPKDYVGANKVFNGDQTPMKNIVQDIKDGTTKKIDIFY